MHPKRLAAALSRPRSRLSIWLTVAYIRLNTLPRVGGPWGSCHPVAQRRWAVAKREQKGSGKFNSLKYNRWGFPDRREETCVWNILLVNRDSLRAPNFPDQGLRDAGAAGPSSTLLPLFPAPFGAPLVPIDLDPTCFDLLERSARLARAARQGQRHAHPRRLRTIGPSSTAAPSFPLIFTGASTLQTSTSTETMANIVDTEHHFNRLFNAAWTGELAQLDTRTAPAQRISNWKKGRRQIDDTGMHRVFGLTRGAGGNCPRVPAVLGKCHSSIVRRLALIDHGRARACDCDISFSLTPDRRAHPAARCVLPGALHGLPERQRRTGPHPAQCPHRP